MKKDKNKIEEYAKDCVTYRRTCHQQLVADILSNQ